MYIYIDIYIYIRVALISQTTCISAPNPGIVSLYLKTMNAPVRPDLKGIKPVSLSKKRFFPHFL